MECEWFFNLSVASIGAGVGAYSGFVLAKVKERKGEIKSTINLLKALKVEEESNKDDLVRAIGNKNSDNVFVRESSSISFEVYKTLQSTAFVHDHLDDDFIKEMVNAIGELRRFKNTKYYNDIMTEDKVKSVIEKIDIEITRLSNQDAAAEVGK